MKKYTTVIIYSTIILIGMLSGCSTDCTTSQRICLSPKSAPSDLRCELLNNPASAITGICDPTPEFGWVVNSDVSYDIQTAYQIMVATNRALLDQDKSDMWNSGKTAGGNSVNVSYAGLALLPNQSYFWKVRTWNKSDQVSDWSVVQKIETGPSLSKYHTPGYNLVESKISPETITEIAKGHYLIDFGKAAFGYLQWKISQESLRVDSVDDTTQKSVEVHFGEKLKANQIDRKPGGTIRYYRVPLEINPEQTLYKIHPPVDKRNTGRDAIQIPKRIGVICPFRYIELINCHIKPTKESIQQIAVFYPFDDHAASFECNNERLSKIWELCKYSIKATTFAGVYVDGDRERIPYEADAYINQLCHYAVDSEFSLARISHEYLLKHPTWPTEWKQHSIMMAWADYLYTGNHESLGQYYEVFKNEKLLAQHARTSDGLLNTKGLRDIVDWPGGERDGYVFKPVNTVVNAFYYHTLQLMEKIATALGHHDDAQQFHQDAEEVYRSFQTVLFNPSTGLYVDGEGTDHSSLHANMFSLAFGLVPTDKKEAVVNFIESKGMACSVYGAQYLLEGLYFSGEEDAAMALITSETARSWFNMMREGSTITMEAWGIAYKPNQDWNHAWGAVPANIIPRFVAGIRPLEPGFAKALIHPQPSTLKEFQIQFPTIRGAVLLSMDKRDDHCTFELTIPANMAAKFVLPKNCDKFSTIKLDGNLIIPQQQGILRYIEPIGSGNHILVAN